MANTLRIEHVETLLQYTQLVESLMADEKPLWYRGVDKASRKLVPSLFRHPTITEADDLVRLERDIIQRFRERSIPYQDTPVLLEDEWSLLFLMQHFGVPTRLLDWTENPFIGLYFAVTSAQVDRATGQTAEAAAVWVFRPKPWNQQALADTGYDGGVLSVGAKQLEPYEPSSESEYMRVFPVAMYGLHNSARIVAQRGVFTIFGKSTEAMDQQYETNDYSADSIVKVEVPEAAVYPLREQLLSIGITDSVVYPDLMGLAKELKRFFEFEL